MIYLTYFWVKLIHLLKVINERTYFWVKMILLLKAINEQGKIPEDQGAQSEGKLMEDRKESWRRCVEWTCIVPGMPTTANG